MTHFETLIPKQQAEIFNTAFYRYIELRLSPDADFVVQMTSIPEGEMELRRVALWSMEAVREFTVFWNQFPKISAPAVLTPRWA